MRKADLVVSVLLLGVAGVVLAEGLRLGFGWGSDGPASGFFVFYLGLALALASGVVLLRAALLADAPLYRKVFVGSGQFQPVLKVLIPAIVMVLATQVIGLYVAGVLYLGVYMRWIGRHRWITIVLVSLAIPIVTFLVFEVWFLVPMPKGPLEHALGY